MPKTIFLLYSGTGSETRSSQSADPASEAKLFVTPALYFGLIILLLPKLIKNKLP